ncbi:MAG: NHLP family bacteriocin export ABC transporter peptidase/permease/ATPase subunit [Candidatus Riflebacteria bacterium]|nr:NHLP family bacteriocin export ABC transporter peptidase/permease/ATPase subunit [Candidatus Riflebacteria bacterium]
MTLPILSKIAAWWRGKPGKKRVVTPTILQMEAVECGAAALAKLMGAYGCYVPLEILREETGVSRDGTKASNILKVARKYGFVAKGFKKSPEGLLEMRMPVIVFWNFNHFIVVEGFCRAGVYINDPASGPRRITHEEFDMGFTGVVLAIEPGEGFKKTGRPPNALRSLWKKLKEMNTGILFLVCITLLLAIPGLIIPAFSRVYIDDILIAGKKDWIKPLIVFMAIITVFQALVSYMQKMVISRFQVRLSLSMAGRFFHHVLNLPMTFFTQRHAGEITNRIGLNDEVAGILTGELASQTMNAALFFFFLLLMFSYNFSMAVMVCCGMAISALLVRVLLRRRDDQMQKLVRETGMLQGLTAGGIMGIETIKAGGHENEFFNRWAGSLNRYISEVQDSSKLGGAQDVMTTFVISATNALVIGVGGYQVMQGHITPGMLVAFQSLANSVIDPFNSLLKLTEKFRQAKVNLTRLDDVLVQPEDKNKALIDQRSEPLKGHLELKNISFGYNRLDPPLIENFSLLMTPGKRVALVGSSGSGKSTISKLVCGLYEHWSGEILFDGKPRNKVNSFDLNSGFSFVDQDIFLFSGTIRDNLTLWDTSMRDADVILAAKDAEIHNDIAVRQGTYQYQVTEGGTNFSGGQRQRLEIARALAGNPSLLVLDEATSALDPATEKLVDDNIRRRGCTCLIVAHRLSTIRDCDEIIVLEKGKIVQRGTHNELKDIEGLYSELIRMES